MSEPTVTKLRDLLGLIDEHFGDLPPSLTARGYSNFQDMPALIEHVVARLAAAITALFADPEFQLSPNGFLQTLPLQRWLGLIFAHTPMRNADHVIYSLNNLGWDSEVVQWKSDDVYKMALITVPDSQVALDLDMIWQASPALAVNLAIAWVSPRFLGTPAAHHRRMLVARDRHEAPCRFIERLELAVGDAEESPVQLEPTALLQRQVAVIPPGSELGALALRRLAAAP